MSSVLQLASAFFPWQVLSLLEESSRLSVTVGAQVGVLSGFLHSSDLRNVGGFLVSVILLRGLPTHLAFPFAEAHFEQHL
jgi:hypothetical protein